MTPEENRNTVLAALLKASDAGSITPMEYTTAYNAVWQLAPAHTVVSWPICRNCNGRIIGHNAIDAHISPCISCGSDGHAGCQHR